MNESRCTICGHRKDTSVPYPLCHLHAEELYRGLLQSSTPAKQRRIRYYERLTRWAAYRDAQRRRG